MMKMKKGIIAAVILGSVTLLSGCSVKETWDVLWGADKESAESGSGTEGEIFDPNAVQVDDSVEAPKFKTNLKGSEAYAVGDKAKALKVEATVEGEGEITYQWYVNSVESNGGGTKIEGATDQEYTPDTTTEGYYYYFVVATNTVNKKINLTTSKIKEIHVDPELEPAPKDGEQKGWIQDKNGWYYLDKNGDKLKSKLKAIDNVTYYFDKKGYMVTGWQEIKSKWYYFNEDGSMATGFNTVDGKKYFLSDKGVMHTGWLDGDGSWFYAGDDGVLVISEWKQIDGAWYYFNEDGVMLSNCEVNGKWLNPDGKLAE